jgi:3-isopropylmalate dehydrogenase
MNFKLMILPGDGIGKEVISAAMKVIKTIADFWGYSFDFEYGLIGGCSYEKFGTPLTDDTLNKCYNSNAVFLGAVGGYKWEDLPHNLKPEAALLKLRKSLELYANIRPAKAYSSSADTSALKNHIIENVDFIVVRELTGGIYFGEPRGFDSEKGFNTMLYRKYEVERIAKKAFEIAVKRKKILTSVDKANVLEVSQFWRNVMIEISKEFPDVKLNHMYVDNAAMQIVRNPKQFDVIVTSNLFGDILSDISGVIVGSLGMLPSASIGYKHALYEPVHGSAPDIAGQNKANPLAAILSAAMLFEYSLNNKKAALAIEKACEITLAEGYRTAEIMSNGGKLASTDEFANIVVENLKKVLSEIKIYQDV